MGLPKLDTCCFIFDLKTGNIILGCFSAVSNIMKQTLISFNMLTMMSFMSFNLCVIMIVAATAVGVEKTELEGLEEAEIQARITGLYVMCVILVLMFLAKFSFDIAFVYAVVTSKPNIIKMYFIMWIVFFLLSMFIFFLNITNFSAGTIFSEVFYIGLNIYVILLSHSYYVKLNTREEIDN